MQSAGVTRLFRPLNVTELLEAAAALVIGRLPQVLIVLVLANLPLLLWQGLAIWSPAAWIIPSRYRAGIDAFSALELLAGVMSSTSLDVRLLVASLLALFCSILQHAAMTQMAVAWIQGESLSPIAALYRSMERLPVLIATFLAPAAVIVFAAWLYGMSIPTTILAVLILLFALPRFLFLAHAVMLEDCAPIRALARSASLSDRHLRHTFGYWLMLELILLGLTSIPTFAIGLVSVNLPAGPKLVLFTILFSNIAIVLMEPFRDVALALMYVDLRLRRREMR